MSGFADIGREPYSNEGIAAMPDDELVAYLRQDAGDYAVVVRNANIPGRVYSWDQRNVRAWEAARRLEATAERERLDWADYLEHWGETVGSPEFTRERLVELLRGPRPFGAQESGS